MKELLLVLAVIATGLMVCLSFAEDSPQTCERCGRRVTNGEAVYVPPREGRTWSTVYLCQHCQRSD